MYQERFYRHHLAPAYSLEVAYRQSDLHISADRKLDRELAKRMVIKYYHQIEDYIRKNPSFASSLTPLANDNGALPLISDMLTAAQGAGLGPIASVAGAVATYVGNELLRYCTEIIVENGGDIFLKINSDKKIGLYLGERFTPQRITLIIRKREYPFGICSSSATIGPSLNFGKADLLTVIGKDAVIADAFATAYSNRIKSEDDIGKVIEDAKENHFIDGIFVAFERKLFFWGDLEVAP